MRQILSIIGNGTSAGHLLRRLILACCAMATLLPLAAASQELGRLFFTPAQRQDLDRRRTSNTQAAVAVVEDRVTANGRVTRSLGPSTTWINGQPQDDPLRERNAAMVRLPPEENQPSVSLKIGETLDRTSGEKRDGLGGGSITIRRGGPPPR
jgi:hypothetical protein